jgi:hypothetical protein
MNEEKQFVFMQLWDLGFLGNFVWNCGKQKDRMYCFGFAHINKHIKQCAK